MKQALLIGCGGQRGNNIVDACLKAGYNVINIGSSESDIKDVMNIKINWKDLDIIHLHKILNGLNGNIDFVFFNQNASSLSRNDFTQSKETLDMWGLVKNWTKSYWLSCQMPFFLIHSLGQKLHEKSIIGWMLSSYIDFNKKGVDDHADYSGYKFTNLMIMRNFSKKYRCFGIDPDFSISHGMTNLIKDICDEKISINSTIFEFDKNDKSKYNIKKDTHK